MENIITKEKLEKYFSVTKAALEKVKVALNPKEKKRAEDFLDMAERYFNDAYYFFNKEDYVNAFAALNYSHGWLDAGARARFFLVNDSVLFTVDEFSE
jgi:uncharacterized protein